MHCVKCNFLGSRESTSITQANRDVLRWVQTTAGLRLHGTTHGRPLGRFELERAALPTTGWWPPTAPLGGRGSG